MGVLIVACKVQIESTFFRWSCDVRWRKDMKKGRDKMDQSWEQNSNYRKHFLVPKKRCMLHGLVHTKLFEKIW